MGRARVLRHGLSLILMGLFLGLCLPAHAAAERDARSTSVAALSEPAPVTALGVAAPPVKEAPQNESSKILDQVDALKAKVEEIRGLKYRAGVKKGLQSPQAFREFLNQSIDKEYPEKKLYAWKRWLVQFGFMDSSVDIKKLLLDLLQEQVVGYYDPERKNLYLIDKDFTDILGGEGKLSKEDAAALGLLKTMGLDLAGMFLVHELDHALEDQYFDLTQLKKIRENSEDRSNALSALIEGQSTLLMIEYMIKGMGLGDALLPQFGELLDGLSATAAPGLSKMGKAPEYFRENLLFPYTQGTKLAFKLRQAGGWNLLNQAFRHPPESTKQVLHPEKYWPTRANPTLIAPPDLQAVLDSGWERLEENTLGELNISILARQFLPAPAAATLGLGWGGDTFQIFENKRTKDTLLVWFTTWDSPEDSQKFLTGYRALLEKKHAGAPAAASGRKTLDNPPFVIERRGRDVLIVEGVGSPLRERILDRAWQSKKQTLAAAPLGPTK